MDVDKKNKRNYINDFRGENKKFYTLGDHHIFTLN